MKHVDIGLAAVVGHTLYFWSAAFGFPGTLNDINALEYSTLFESMVNGEHNKLEFNFTVDSEVFTLSVIRARPTHQTCFQLCE